ncbi:MAG TPA: hypothetical protein VGT40_14550 [Methylomirabilota bacterium]|nr:hypothetical protein [Methylomirabilota bacterium]
MANVAVRLGVALALLASYVASAHAATLVSCGPAGYKVGDRIDRGFYIPSYPGSSLQSVALRIAGGSSGPGTLTLTARAGTYDGPLIGSSTVNVTGPISAASPITFTFADNPAVFPGSTVTFAITATGITSPFLDYSVFDDGADPSCPVIETDGTTPPLDTDRRRGVEIIVTGGTGGCAAPSGAVTTTKVRPDSSDVEAGGIPLVAAVLPASRSVQVNCAATAFVTIINAGSATATAVGIAPATGIPANFTYQTTDSHTNAVTGSPNTPADIEAGKSQSYVIALTPTAGFPPTDVAFSFAGINTAPVATLTGINTLLLSGSPTPVPDIVALAATTNNDGIVNIPGASGSGAFAVATVNVGASASITATADTGGASLPVTIALCQTNSGTGQCISPIGTSAAVQINTGETPTFAIFVTGSGTVPFDPAANRVFVRFKDAGGTTRGATSVAVRTQ